MIVVDRERAPFAAQGESLKDRTWVPVRDHPPNPRSGVSLRVFIEMEGEGS